MKRKTAAAKPKQAPKIAQSLGRTSSAARARGSIGLILSVPIGLRTRAFVGFGRNVDAGRSNRGGGRRLLAPFVDEKNNDGGAGKKIEDGHEPGDQAEAGLRRLGVDRGAEFLDKGLRDFVFGVAAADHRAKLFQHGGGRGAADVVALRENLPAVAHAEEFAADFLHTVGLLLSKKREDGKECDTQKGDHQATRLRTMRCRYIWR